MQKLVLRNPQAFPSQCCQSRQGASDHLPGRGASKKALHALLESAQTGRFLHHQAVAEAGTMLSRSFLNISCSDANSSGVFSFNDFSRGSFGA